MGKSTCIVLEAYLQKAGQSLERHMKHVGALVTIHTWRDNGDSAFEG
jgi:hypothetical protein